MKSQISNDKSVPDVVFSITHSENKIRQSLFIKEYLQTTNTKIIVKRE